MLVQFARWLIVRKRLVLAATVGFVILAGAIGGNVAKHLSSGGFDDPNSENSQVRRIIDRQFPLGATPNVVVLVTAKNGNIDDPAVVEAGRHLTADLAARPSIKGLAFSYWTIPGALPLKSKAGNQALVLAKISGDDDAVRKEIDHISPAFTRDDALIEARVGGFAEVFRQVGTTIEKDLGRAESIAIPITLILLILVFGSATAATLPLAIGALSVVGTFLILRVLSSVTQVSIFSLNLTTAMGLGLAIDYSLFIVSRYREELAAGWRTREAIIRTVATAGRTVLFSALTVAISLAALLVFPLSFLRSFAYAGVGVVFMAAIGAIVVLPALLALLGDRINRFSLFHRTPKTVIGQGFWHRIATAVMRRPVITGGSVIVLLLFLGAPFLNIRFGLPDDRVLPASATSRMVQDDIRSNFNSNEASALAVVGTGIGDAAARGADIDGYAARLSRLRGVARVDAVTGIYARGQRLPVPANAAQQLTARLASPDGVMIDVIPSVEAVSPAGERLVKEVRAQPSPFPVKVGGSSAQLVDSKASLFGRMPLALLIIALVTFTVLFLMTGSVLVPVKAVVLNLLSLTATF